jgi:hypothetical protein
MRILQRAAVAFIAVTAMACASEPIPTAPPSAVVTAAPPPPPANPLPVPGGPAASSLAFSTVTVLLFQRTTGAVFQYEPEILGVSETTGGSGVNVQRIDVITPGGTIESDCVGLGGPLRIEPGQTSDLAARLSYCIPYAVTRSEETQVTVHVAFVDDNGRDGAIQRTLDVSACTLGGKPGLTVCK